MGRAALEKVPWKGAAVMMLIGLSGALTNGWGGAMVLIMELITLESAPDTGPGADLTFGELFSWSLVLAPLILIAVAALKTDREEDAQ